MLSKKRKQDAATLLGGASLGVGLALLVAPGLGGRMLGMKPDATPQAGSRLAVRALGIRDVAFGIGLFLTRKDRQAGAIWRRLFGLCMGVDAGAALLALRKPGANFFTFAGGFSSIGLAILAFISAQED